MKIKAALATLVTSLALVGAPQAAAQTTVAWGENYLAQLGVGFQNNLETVPLANVLPGIKQLSSGSGGGLALMEDGTVKVWGEDAYGQFGNGTHEWGSIAIEPIAVPGLTGVTEVSSAVGGAHSMALLKDGTVKTWGDDLYGQSGNGTSGGRERENETLVPVKARINGVVAIASGGADDAAILSNGTVDTWGENRDGQLGDGTTVLKDVPTPVPGLSGAKAIAVGGLGWVGGRILVLLNNGTVDNLTTVGAVPVPGLSHVVAISASWSHNLALLSDGTVKAWGDNTDGELGVRTTETCGLHGGPLLPCSRGPVTLPLSHVTQVSAGWRYSMALADGIAYSWGLNQRGQLGDGTSINKSTPTSVKGLEEPTRLLAGQNFSFAFQEDSGAPLNIHVVPGVEALTVNWQASGNEYLRWRIRWRPITDPHSAWSSPVFVSATDRSYTIAGLKPVPYEVSVLDRDTELFNREVAQGTPLPRSRSAITLETSTSNPASTASPSQSEQSSTPTTEVPSEGPPGRRQELQSNLPASPVRTASAATG